MPSLLPAPSSQTSHVGASMPSPQIAEPGAQRVTRATWVLFWKNAARVTKNPPSRRPTVLTSSFVPTLPIVNVTDGPNAMPVPS